MTTQSANYPDDTCDKYTALALIWGDDDAVEPNQHEQDQQTKLKQELILLTDAFIKLSDNPAWIALAQQHPELENARYAAVCAADNVWWQFRTKISN